MAGRQLPDSPAGGRTWGSLQAQTAEVQHELPSATPRWVYPGRKEAPVNVHDHQHAISTELESNPEASGSEYKKKKEKNSHEKEGKMRKADSFMLVCGGLAAGDEFVRTNVSQHLEPPPTPSPPKATACQLLSYYY